MSHDEARAGQLGVVVTSRGATAQTAPAYKLVRRSSSQVVVVRHSDGTLSRIRVPKHSLSQRLDRTSQPAPAGAGA